MIEINIKVAGQNAQALKRYSIVAGSVNDHEAIFTFDTSWDGMAKSVQFSNGTVHDERLLTNDRTLIPTTVIAESGYLYIKPYAVVLDDTGHILERKKTTTPVLIQVTNDGLIDLTIPYPVTPTMYEELLGIATQARTDAEQAKTDAAQTAPLRDETLGYRNEAEGFKDETEIFKTQAVEAKDRSVLAENNAKISETSAGRSEGTATRAMQDFLAMLGSDVPVLENGKIPIRFIDAMVTHDSIEIESVDDLVTLSPEVVQKGDIAELIELVDGERTITKSYKLLGTGDPSIRENWIRVGTAYATQAASANQAITAENSLRVNGRRIVTMTYTQLENAVIVEDTVVLAFPDGTFGGE